jgi:osmotically-inducible protein OsmY
MLGHEEMAGGATALLRLRPAQQVPLAELAERQLRSSPYLALRNVTCEARDGVVVLRGCLPTYYLKQMAQAVITRVEGVGQIVNEIEVVPASAVAAPR